MLVGCPSSSSSPPSASPTTSLNSSTGASPGANSAALQENPAAKTTPSAPPPTRVVLSVERESSDWQDTQLDHNIEGQLSLIAQPVALDLSGFDATDATRRALCAALTAPLSCASTDRTTPSSTTPTSLQLTLQLDNPTTPRIVVSGHLQLEAHRPRAMHPTEQPPAGPRLTLTLSAQQPIAEGVAQADWMRVAGPEALRIWRQVYSAKLDQRAQPLPSAVRWAQPGLQTAALHARAFHARRRMTSHFIGDHLWQVRHFDQAWVLDRYTRGGERLSHVFQDPDQGTPKQPWISDHKGRLVMVVGDHQPIVLPQPGSPEFRDQPAPEQRCAKRPCPGLKVIALDPSGEVTMLAESADHHPLGRAMVDGLGQIHVAAQERRTAEENTTTPTSVLLRFAPDTPSPHTLMLPEPIIPRRGLPFYRYYDLHLISARTLLIHNGHRLWTLDTHATRGEELRPYATWRDTPSEVLPDGAGGVILVDHTQDHSPRLKRLSPAGRERWTQPSHLALGPPLRLLGDVVEGVGLGLYPLDTGRPITTETRTSQRHGFTRLKEGNGGGGFVGCGPDGLVHLSADGKPLASLPLPWSCRAVERASDGMLLVATVPPGAYGVAPPTLWDGGGAPKEKR